MNCFMAYRTKYRYFLYIAIENGSVLISSIIFLKMNCYDDVLGLANS